MKHSNPSRLTAILLLLITCFATAQAATVDIDGITYNTSGAYAYVSYKSDGTIYSGDIIIPDKITVDGTTYPVLRTTDSSVFDNCYEMTSFTAGANFTPGNNTFKYCYNLKHVTFNYVARRSFNLILPERCFYMCSSLETVTFPTNVSKITINDYAFYECNKLKSLVNFPTDINYYTLGKYAFYRCCELNPLEYIDLAKVVLESSDRYSTPTHVFFKCNISKVTIPDGWTSIPDYLFGGCQLTEVTIPTSVEEIGDYAFFDDYGIYPVATPILHEGLKHFGEKVFCGIENLNIPSTLETLGLPNLPTKLKSVTVAEGNKYFEVKDNALYKNVLDDNGSVTNKILRNVIAGNGYTGPSVWKETDALVTEISDYAFSNIPVSDYDIPNLKTVGDRAFEHSSIEKATIKKGIKYGSGTFHSCQNLKEVTIEDGVKTLPRNIFFNCNNLKSFPVLPKSLTTLNNGYAFSSCGFSYVFLHSRIESIHRSTFSRNVTNVECMNPIPPFVGDYTNSEYTDYLYMPDVTLTVPQSSVELYKQHEVWGQCKEIIGNPDWEGLGTVTSLPSGLWFAQKGGNICYLNNGLHDTGIPAGAHPFQMQIHGNALYVADAGEKHYYSNDGNSSGTGDGQLYKVECSGNSFAKTPMLIHAGEGSHNDDPYTCFIDHSNGDIYASNRSYGVYKFNIADNNWFVEQLKTPVTEDNNFDINTVNYFVRHPWLDYYGGGISYGAIPHGFQRDSNGVNWLLIGYNGYGIYRFRDSDIHYNGNINPSNRPFGHVFPGTKLTSMYIDETNGYLYVFSRMPAQYGLYRIALSDISDTDYTNFKNLELIDASPASPENTTADECVHVRQITGDGKYIYWSYIAEEGSGHSCGIKMIPATGTPTVSYLIEGIEAYSLAVKDFDPSGIEQVAADFTAPKLVNVTGNRISAVEDVTVTAYSTGGAVEAVIDVAAGETVLLDNLTRGIHIIRATAADGTTATLKTAL